MNQNVPLGAALMGLAAVLFPIKDGIVKALAGTVSGVEAGGVYFATQAALALTWLLVRGTDERIVPARSEAPALLLRSALLVASVLLFFVGVQRAPIAEAVVLFALQALFAILFAGLLLGERLTLRTWAVALTGFAGAAIILRPDVGEAFNPFLLFPFASAVTFGLYVAMTKRLGVNQHPVVLLFYDGAVGFALTVAAILVATLAGVLPVPDALFTSRSLAFLIASGAVGMVSALLIIVSLRLAPASVIAPLGYLEIASAALIGVLVFSEPITLPMAIGTAIIVSACLAASRTKATGRDDAAVTEPASQ